MKAVNVDDILKILHKYGKYIFVTDEKSYCSMVDEIANLKELKQEPKTGHWIPVSERLPENDGEMADDVELIIKINKNTYDRITSGFADEDDAVLFENLLKNGAPLPKGHGRILDEKDILDTKNNDGGFYDLVDMPEYIAGVKAIIEADKVEREE